MWDLRKGQSYPSLIRAIFELTEDGKWWSLADLKATVDEDLQTSPTSVRNLTAALARDEWLLAKKNGRTKYGRNSYMMTEKALVWWEKHQREAWGLGEEWEPDEGWDDDPKPSWVGRVQDGATVKISLPCHVDTWRALTELGKKGEIEILVRLKQ